MTTLRDLALDNYLEAFDVFLDEPTTENEALLDEKRDAWRREIVLEEAQTRLPV